MAISEEPARPRPLRCESAVMSGPSRGFRCLKPARQWVPGVAIWACRLHCNAHQQGRGALPTKNDGSEKHGDQ